MATAQDTSSACTVTLTAFPADRKVSVIRAICYTTGLSLKDTGVLAESLPATIDLSTFPAAPGAEAMGWSAAVAARELAGALITAGATAKIGAPELSRAQIAAALEAQRSRVFEVQGVVGTVMRVMSAGANDPNGLDNAAVTDAWKALELAERQLDHIAGQLEADVLLNPTDLFCGECFTHRPREQAEQDVQP